MKFDRIVVNGNLRLFQITADLADRKSMTEVVCRSIPGRQMNTQELLEPSGHEIGDLIEADPLLSEIPESPPR